MWCSLVHGIKEELWHTYPAWNACHVTEWGLVVSKPPERFNDQLLTASSVKGHDAHMSGCRKEGRVQTRSCQIASYSGQWVESQQTQGRKPAGHLPSQSSADINGKELLIAVWFDIGWLYIEEMLKTQDKEKWRILLLFCTYWELNVNALLFQQRPNRTLVILENYRYSIQLKPST